jgi:hypothetical protein
MGRFLWNQGHSKQRSDKGHTIAHDWSSKDNAEPSGQALNDLTREYGSFESVGTDGSPKYKGRSRTNTVNSAFSYYARSTSEGSNDVNSRPSSRQSFVESGMPFQDRQESTAKTLLSKGSRMLKRQGSKLNLLSSQPEDVAGEAFQFQASETSPPSRLQRQFTMRTKRKLHDRLQ